MSAVASWQAVIVDTEQPQALATFYEQLLGFVRVQDGADFVVIGDAPDRPGIAFQRVDRHVPPQWPDAEHPQQMHLDLRVPSGTIEGAESRALELGARRLEGGGDNFRVYADPAGHPFCLVWW